MKIAVIGCTHAGTAAVLNIKKMYRDAEITVYERNDTVSFLSCGIALYVGGVVKDPQGLFYCSPEKLSELGVKTRMKHNVTSIDIEQKKLVAENLVTGEKFDDNFDKLIVTSGSWPIIPNVPGIDLNNILVSKNYEHSNTIVEKVGNANNITVVGAGYIGVELAEAFRLKGKSVNLIDSQKRILSRYLDREFTDPAEEVLTENGVKLILGESITAFEGTDGKVNKVVTDKGSYATDLVIMCIGFRPNTALFKDKLEMLPNGAIVVDEYMRTSNKDVLAAGDCCAVVYNPTGRHEYIPLATNAVRMGTLAALNLMEEKVKYMGTQGTSGIKIYDYNIAATGITEETAVFTGLDVKTSLLVDNYRPEFMPEYESVKIKVVYGAVSGRILGAQIISKADLTQSINTLSVCIQNKMTIDQLAFVDFFFQPHFNKPWNFLNTVGLNTLT